MNHPSFADLGVSAPVVNALSASGIEMPFEVQSKVVPDGIAGHDVLVKSPTGSGKTMAFALPIAERLDTKDRTPAALVLVPTRELAVQVAEDLGLVAAGAGLRTAAAYGGIAISSQAKAVERAHVLIATPGRLDDLAKRGAVRLDHIKILVLDEADRMLDMGFRPQVARIVRRLPQRRQTMFFSATLDGEVAELAKAYTHNPRRHEVHVETPVVEDAEHRFHAVSAGGKVDAVVKLLEGERGLTLIFVRTKRGVERLADKLKARGIRVVAMHGDMQQSARERALARFESGKVDTLVATDVAARGLDLEHITHVINFDPPNDHKDYVHRVGRTARAGRSGIGITLVQPEQEADVSRIASRLRLQDEYSESGMRVAAPTVVYRSTRGRKSMLYRPPRRRA
ncbi:MAG TPA: DEAD/DEAH box helicase [Actinomycetota bacterium]|jgi:superfamily II DNA/RNA helicase